MKKKITDVKKEYLTTETKLNTAIKYLEKYQKREKEQLSPMKSEFSTDELTNASF